LVSLTHHFLLPAATLCSLYQSHWQVDLFFKWFKQHLRINRFFGSSENAVKSQIWIAVSVYVLDASLYTLLQILSLTLFEKMPLQQALQSNEYSLAEHLHTNQLNLS
jgi:IS4 transposase